MNENFDKKLNEIFEGYSEASHLIDEVIDAYRQPHRFYHRLEHVQDMFLTLEEFRDCLAQGKECFAAALFHDWVYDPSSFQNEEASARLAVKFLETLHYPEASVTFIEKLILSTKKHTPFHETFDEQLFLDADLKTLGAASGIYQKYKEAVRKEFSFIQEKVYRMERVRVLNHFLEKEKIYFTEIFRDQYELRARKNIQDEIKELS